ncbi:MAG TPA: hypothetical protein VFR97_08445 [Capillimicrobium sp.]|nr:hypothetical protein [Capillimicrobium sp.]
MSIRTALRLDAVVTGANGVAYLVAAGALDGLLGMPASFLRAVGAFLVVFAAAVWTVSSRPRPAGVGVLAVVVANVLWVVDSLALLAFDWLSPTTAGQVWVALQAVTVVGFAALQAYAASARTRRVSATA